MNIESLVQGALATGPAAGIAYAVTNGERTLESGAFGFADLAGGRPLNTQHLFQIGSIGKSFTALALMQLYEAGIFDPHTPVFDYLPWLEIANGGHTVTGHHLLTHTAGIITGTDEGITAWAEAWMLRQVYANPPQTGFHYSNTGYKILGLVLERLTGRAYEEVLRDRVLAPLGMESSRSAIVNGDRPLYAEGYIPFPEGETIPTPFLDKSSLYPVTWLETRTGDGCIAAPIEDMAVYTRAMMSGFEGLIRPDTFERMLDPAGYGYGIARKNETRPPRFGHTGGMLGHFCALLFEPESNLGAIVLMSGPAEPEALAHRILNTYLGKEADTPLQAPAEPPNSANPEALPDNLRPLTGTYRTHNPWYSQIRVMAGQEGLVLIDAFGDPEPLTEISTGVFRVGDPTSPERLQFDMWIEELPHRAIYSGASYYRTDPIA